MEQCGPPMAMLPLRSLLSGESPERARPAVLETRGLRVRAMRPEDRAAILRIESTSFPDAWPAEAFDRFHVQANASCHVVPHGSECLAFFIVVRERGYLHLANLAVAPEVRRRGLGAFCLQAGEKFAWAYALPRVELEVRETTLAAQLLYRRCGYRAVEIRRSYYGDQDGYRMTKSVDGVRASSR
jgi:ribosomal-protein-alanine N-acetyltransferase